MIVNLAAIPERHRATLEAIGEAARGAGARAFLVGGPVRDLLLDGVINDIDVTIEGNAATAVRSLVDAMGFQARAHGEFLTFKIRVGAGDEIDIATTRRERYAHPGALPLVEPAPIEEDLRRRDFSINALALEIGPWTMLDPTSGLPDLERRLLRALHRASFVDDPTRILRGLRLAARLELTWEPETHRWLIDAIDRNAIATVSRERVWRELFRAATERRRGAVALLSIARSGVLEQLLGIASEPVESAAIERLDHAPEAMFENEMADRALIRLALLFAGTSASAETLRGAPLSDRQSAELLSIAHGPRRPSELLAGLTEDGSRFDTIEAMFPEERVLATVYDAGAASLITRYARACRTRIEVRGDELGVPPGPWIGKALRAVIKAIFIRAITPGEAAAFARCAAVDYLRGQDRNE